MTEWQDFYDRVKKHPDVVIKDVGEAHPLIIHQTEYLCTMKDGSQKMRTVYWTFEYVKKNMKEFKRCDCETCRNIITAYRVNKKALSGATPEQVDALIPDSWELEVLQ